MSPPLTLDVARAVEPPTISLAAVRDRRALRLARLLTRRLDRVRRTQARRVDAALTARRTAAQREALDRIAILTAFTQCGLR